MKVWVQLRNAEERSYENATRVDDSDRYEVKVYGAHGVLAIIDRADPARGRVARRTSRSRPTREERAAHRPAVRRVCTSRRVVHGYTGCYRSQLSRRDQIRVFGAVLLLCLWNLRAGSSSRRLRDRSALHPRAARRATTHR